MTVHMFPSIQLFEAISDLINRWRWQQIVVVYSNPNRKFIYLFFLKVNLLVARVMPTIYAYVSMPADLRL